MLMKVTGEDYEMVKTFVNKRYVVGTSIWDHNHSSNYLIKKDSVFEVFSDENETAESYKIMVRDKGKDSPLYLINTIFKNWILDYIKRY